MDFDKSAEVNFDIESVGRGHHNMTYRGIKTVKCPFDYILYQMIICSLKPDLVIEIGTAFGGAALYMADLMNIINHGVVHTIDIIKYTTPLIEKHPRIQLFTDGWSGYNLNNTKNFSNILVIEDGSHMYEDCIGALNKFAPIVSKGNYLIVEDSIISAVGGDAPFNGGPLRAIKEFLESNKNFEIDRAYCDFFGKNATFNVNGYLKRIN
jgi:cephalosporin hydroxylase